MIIVNLRELYYIWFYTMVLYYGFIYSWILIYSA